MFSPVIDIDFALNTEYLMPYAIAAFGQHETLQGSEHDIYVLLNNAMKIGDIPEIRQYCGRMDFLRYQNRDFAKFMQSQNIDTHFMELDGGHTWEVWDIVIKDFIDNLPIETIGYK